jgi:DNA-binding transcriptional LysR family regulator
MQWDERIGRRLKLRDINILLAVVQYGSMTKAAARLAMSQPVVSKAIADLEHTLGVSLLDRSRQGIEPTPYGRALLNRGLAAFDELRQGVKEIEFLADPAIGEVRVGGAPPMVEALLPIVIARLHRRHPRLTVQVTQALTGAALYQDLRERKVDFILARMLTSTLDQDLSGVILFDEPLMVVAGRQNRWAHRRRVELAELTTEPWVMPPCGHSGDGATVGALIAQAFRDAGLDPPQAAVVSTSIPMIHALLTTGPFLAMLPRSVLWFSAMRQSMKILPVVLKEKPLPVGIVTLKNRILNPAAQLFIGGVRDIGSSLAKGQTTRRR